MTTTRDAIAAYISGDATLAALLTGGVYSGGTLNTTDTPNAFDTYGRVKPCVVVKAVYTSAEGGNRLFNREQVAVFIYDAVTLANIVTAEGLIRNVLWRKKLSAGWQVEYLDTLPDGYDGALNSDMAVMHFEAIRKPI